MSPGPEGDTVFAFPFEKEKCEPETVEHQCEVLTVTWKCSVWRGDARLELGLLELKATRTVFVKTVSGAHCVAMSRDLSGSASWDKPLDQGL